LRFPLQKLLTHQAAIVPIIARSGEQLATEEQRDCSATVKHQAMTKMLFAAEVENATCRNKAEPAAIWKARKYIEKHSREELSLTKLARMVNMNANYLSENFKQVTGVNFVEYVARTRFANACDLLGNPNLRISEIAFAVGFQSLSQFNRVFKRLSGKSPTDYREGESAAFSVRRTCGQFPFNVVRPVRRVRIAEKPSATQDSHSKSK
jgi:YesN/AraC family two-component response regulator